MSTADANPQVGERGPKDHALGPPMDALEEERSRRAARASGKRAAFLEQTKYIDRSKEADDYEASSEARPPRRVQAQHQTIQPLEPQQQMSVGPVLEDSEHFFDALGKKHAVDSGRRQLPAGVC